jgi:hypothetical protein
VSSLVFQVSCPARSAWLVLRVTTPDGAAPGGTSRGLGMETGLLRPPVLGMVARQFSGRLPASSWVGRPFCMDTGLLRPPVLGMVARQFSGWLPAGSWVGRPFYDRMLAICGAARDTAARSNPLKAAAWAGPYPTCQSFGLLPASSGVGRPLFVKALPIVNTALCAVARKARCPFPCCVCSPTTHSEGSAANSERIASCKPSRTCTARTSQEK